MRLSGTAERRIHELSGGQRQRVALARALAQQRPGAADGRAVRRARRDHPRRAPRRADPGLEADRATAWCSSPTTFARRCGWASGWCCCRHGPAGWSGVAGRHQRAAHHRAPEVSALAAEITVRLREEIASHARLDAAAPALRQAAATRRRGPGPRGHGRRRGRPGCAGDTCHPGAKPAWRRFLSGCLPAADRPAGAAGAVAAGLRRGIGSPTTCCRRRPACGRRSPRWWPTGTAFNVIWTSISRGSDRLRRFDRVGHADRAGAVPLALAAGVASGR